MCKFKTIGRKKGKKAYKQLWKVSKRESKGYRQRREKEQKIRGKEEGCKEGGNERRNKGRRLISLFLFFCSELFLIEAIGQYRSSFYSIFWPSTPSRDLVR